MPGSFGSQADEREEHTMGNLGKRNEQQKQRLLSIASSLLAQAFTYPFYNLANWLNKSSYMAVYARKKE